MAHAASGDLHVAGFPLKIELPFQCPADEFDQSGQVVDLNLGHPLVEDLGDRFENPKVEIHLGPDLRAPDFQGHHGSVLPDYGAVDLGEGGRSQRRFVEHRKNVFKGPAQTFLDGFNDLIHRHRRGFVLELCQLLGQFLGQHVGAEAQDLTEFDEARPEFVEGHAQTLEGGQFRIDPGDPVCHLPAGQPEMAQHVAETILSKYGDNLLETPQILNGL